jgi:putative FmdB family regulatory protein
MLTYEYECESCGLRFERRQAITEDPVRECPDCRGKAHRLISGGSGFIMKGGGGGGLSSSVVDSCCFEQTGTTCCGRDQRCGKTHCGSGS